MRQRVHRIVFGAGPSLTPPSQVSASASATFVGPAMAQPLPQPYIRRPTASIVVPKSTNGPSTRLFNPPIVMGSGPCSGVNCGPGQTCVNGQCLSTSCMGVVCPPGQTCINGQCVGPVPEVGVQKSVAFVAPPVDPSAKSPGQPLFVPGPPPPPPPPTTKVEAKLINPTSGKAAQPYLYTPPTVKDVPTTGPLKGGVKAGGAVTTQPQWVAPAGGDGMPAFAPPVPVADPGPAPMGLLAGGAVGFFVGGPIGAAVGALLGSFLGGQPAAPTPPVGYWR